ncbi:7529_t:CDS:2 [Paraglomus occultum]|uniref:7529_t:CDS:1 n=1 Tax=Paraglomus occultum TaxID=144539 RepID=A0A9N9CGK7_9GLOM|nr:7529_t:CDS:2 [Paraglomus occultum]
MSPQWTADEDNLLRLLAAQCDEDWFLVARRLYDATNTRRTAKQCRDRESKPV